MGRHLATTAPPTRRKETAAQRKAIQAGRQKRMDIFINNLRKEQDKHHTEAVARNQVKVAAQIKKNRLAKGKHNHSTFKPIFGDKVNKALAKAGKDIEKGSDKFVNKTLKPVAKTSLKVLDWSIDHSADIADGMAITGAVLTVVAGAVAATGIGLPIAAGIELVAVALEAGAPVVRNQGKRAKKIKDIAKKIIALVELIKTSNSTKDRLIAVAGILEQAAKINNDKELVQAAKLIRDTIKVVEASITHAELLLEAVKKGDLIAGIRASIELGKDVKKGKAILESGVDLFNKAKALLTPEATKQREQEAKEKAEKEAKRIAEGGETRTELNKKLKSELFAMAERRGLNPSARLLKADLITLLLNNPVGKAQPKKTPIIPPLPSKEEIEAMSNIPPEILPERKVRKKSTRKPSAYNIFIGKRLKEGMTFRAAVDAWNKQKAGN